MMKKKPTGSALIVLLGCGLIGFQPLGNNLTRYLFLRFDPSGELLFSAGSDDTYRMNQALGYGADVNARGSYVGRTPLMVAAIHGKPEATRFLLAHGAEPNVKDAKGLTALDLATSQHHPDVAQVLLEAGAKL